MRLTTLAGEVFVGHPALIPTITGTFTVVRNLYMSPSPAFPTGHDAMKNNRVRGLKSSNHIPIQVRGLTDIQAITLDEATSLTILVQCRHNRVCRSCHSHGDNNQKHRLHWSILSGWLESALAYVR
jgi:hypothetical protein